LVRLGDCGVFGSESEHASIDRDDLIVYRKLEKVTGWELSSLWNEPLGGSGTNWHDSDLNVAGNTPLHSSGCVLDGDRVSQRIGITGIASNGSSRCSGKEDGRERKSS